MTTPTPTPDVPLRMELTFELPGTPEQLWDAIATANGISSWFLPTDLEERAGGAIVTHMGPDDSPGTVTGWDPPRRLEYEEPDWVRLTGHGDAVATPLVTEFLVEARSGGSCVLRVVSSAFGTGANWEQEFFDEMEKGWRPYFDRLRLYLTHFRGQRVTLLDVQASLAGTGDAVFEAMRNDLGIEQVGQTFELRDLRGTIERLGDVELLVRLNNPVPGFLAVAVLDMGDNKTTAVVQGQLFAERAAAVVEREQPEWQAWLESLALTMAR
ncbi:MAG: SRPBCC family protein [Acidimicrobiia bacterium]